MNWLKKETDAPNNGQIDLSTVIIRGLFLKTKLDLNELYDTQKIDTDFPDIKLVCQVGKGSWANFLYFIPSEGKYVEKGPFGTPDAVCYRLCHFYDSEGVNNWIKEVKDFWKKYFPHIKIEN